MLFVGAKLSGLLRNDPDTVHGGAELQHATIARSLVERGWKIDVISAGSLPNVDWVGGTIWHVPGPWSRVAAMWKLYRAFRSSKATLCLTLGATPFIIVYALLSILTSKEFILGIQHDWDLSRKHMRIKRWRRLIYFAGLRLCSLLIVQHDQQRRDALRLVSCPIEIVPNYLLVDIMDPPPPLGDSFLWIGTYRSYKRPEFALDMAEYLPDVKFTVVCRPTHSANGSDNSQRRPAFERLVDRAKTLLNVSFIPGCTHEEVGKYLLTAKALLITSDGEGWPNVLLEAAAYGRPVLSLHDVAGGIISRNNIGFVADAMDNAVKILAKKEDHEWYELGMNAHQYVKDNFSNAVLTDRLMALFRATGGLPV